MAKQERSENAAIAINENVVALLRPGDVLLSLGIGNTSTAIQALDGGDYSHAGLWTGQGVLESTMPVVVEHTLSESLRAHPRAHVRAFRHPRCMGAVAEEVVRSARTYVARKYPCGDLFLCAALIAVASRFPGRSQLRVLQGVCETLHLLRADKASDEEHVTCTQLVVRAYSLGGLPLHILPRGGERIDGRAIAGAAMELLASKDAGDGQDDELAAWAALQADAAALCRAWEGAPPGDEKGALTGWDGPVLAEGQWRANLVTPRNLQESPDLQFVGEVFRST